MSARPEGALVFLCVFSAMLQNPKHQYGFDTNNVLSKHNHLTHNFAIVVLLTAAVFNEDAIYFAAF